MTDPETGTPISELDTPALIIDLDVMEANISLMAVRADAAGVALRPHAKTHKSVEIARRQLNAGATGICVAKLAEAEVFASHGIGRILVTSPVVSARGIARLHAVNRVAENLIVVVDSADNARALASGATREVSVLVDIDPGMGRTGVAFGDATLDLVKTVCETPGLRWRGVQCYGGNLQHLPVKATRALSENQLTESLRATIALMRANGFIPDIVSGGGTGTSEADLAGGVFTELQAGSYVFMDGEYCPIEGVDYPPALFVATRVISANHPGFVTCDAGLKAFAMDKGAPEPVGGAIYRASSDEHGYLFDGTKNVGDVILCLTPHCDPTVNLYDRYHVVRDGRLVDIWPVDARGRSQ